MRLIDADKLDYKTVRVTDGWCERTGKVIFKDSIESEKTVNAIVIPKGATNGDMIKTLFPNIKTWDESEGALCVEFKTLNQIKIFPKYWWNAPYGKEIEK